MILRDKLGEKEEPFDYLFVDCPPSLGVLTLNALSAVEEVFIPLQPHFLALHGLSKLLETIDLVSRRLNNRRNDAVSSYPTASATSSTPLSSVSSICLASSTRSA